MTPRAWAIAFLDLSVLGWYAIAARLLIEMYPATTWVIAFGVALLVLIVMLSVFIVREGVVLWALLWDAGFRGALAKAERDEAQGEADFKYSQALEAMNKAQAERIEELTGTVETQATMIRNGNAKIAALEEQVEGLKRANGRRREDKP